MAMTNCKDCKTEVSKNAKQCPQCGAPVKGRASITMIVFSLIIMLWILGQMFGQSS